MAVDREHGILPKWGGPKYPRDLDLPASVERTGGGQDASQHIWSWAEKRMYRGHALRLRLEIVHKIAKNWEG
jgi:hypothetical protein